jgi:hypothetical protein
VELPGNSATCRDDALGETTLEVSIEIWSLAGMEVVWEPSTGVADWLPSPSFFFDTVLKRSRGKSAMAMVMPLISIIKEAVTAEIGSHGCDSVL